MPDMGCFFSGGWGGIKRAKIFWKFIFIISLWYVGSFNPTPSTEQHCVAPESTHTSPVEWIFSRTPYLAVNSS